MISKLKRIFPIVIIEEDSIVKIILKMFEHHPNHYIELNIFGKTIRPCARCFGLWTGILIGFFFSAPFWLGMIRANNFYLIFAISWLLAFPSIIGWSTVKLGLRQGNNNIRAAAGFLHGIGIITYFVVLPASILFKIVTYFAYELIFNIIRTHLHFKQQEKKPEGVVV